MIHEYFLLYLVITGAISFALFGVDKWRALKGKWRVSEKVLLWSCGIGGFLGGMAGMSYFRHKTVKGSFLWRFWCIIGAWVLISIGVLIRGGN